MFLKLPVIIIIGFDDNVLWIKYIDIYKLILGAAGGGEPGPPYIFCLLFKKTEIVQEPYLY